MTEISSEEAECSNGVATIPCDCRDTLKVAKVRSIFVALISDVVHEAKKCPFSFVTAKLLLPEICDTLDSLKASSSLEEAGGGRGGFGSSLKYVHHFFQPTSPTVHPWGWGGDQEKNGKVLPLHFRTMDYFCG